MGIRGKKGLIPILEAESQQKRELELILSVHREKKRLLVHREGCWSWAELFGETMKSLEEKLYIGKREKVAQLHVTG